MKFNEVKTTVYFLSLEPMYRIWCFRSGKIFPRQWAIQQITPNNQILIHPKEKKIKIMKKYAPFVDSARSAFKASFSVRTQE